MLTLEERSMINDQNRIVQASHYYHSSSSTINMVQPHQTFNSASGEVSCLGSLLTEAFFLTHQLLHTLPLRELPLLPPSPQQINNKNNNGPLQQPYFLSVGPCRPEPNNKLTSLMVHLLISPIHGHFFCSSPPRIRPQLFLGSLAP